MTKLSLTLSPSTLTIPRGNKSTVTCSTPGQEGGDMEFKISGTTLVNSDIYNIGPAIRTNFDINGEIRRQIEITAKGPSIASSDASCSVTDAAQGFVQCQQTIQCSLVYADIPALGDSKTVTVTVTGLIGKGPSDMPFSGPSSLTIKLVGPTSVPLSFAL